MKYVIIDMDGCIADDSWRIKHIDWHRECPEDRYRIYHALAPSDPVCNRDLFNTDAKIVIFTARPISFSAATEEWLQKAGVRYEHLFMRGISDHSHSAELKEKQLMLLFNLEDITCADIAAAYDDREDVVAMYAQHGIPAFVRKIKENQNEN